MKGICFIEQLFHATIVGRKIQTRRTMEQPISFEGLCGSGYIGKPIGKKGFIKPRYKVGEIVYLKEPYRVDEQWTEYIINATPEAVRGQIKSI